MIFKDIETILFSQEFRNLQNKTQLFYQTIGARVRTRLTHTIEVRAIAYKIGKELNEKIKNSSLKNKDIYCVDLELIDIIAYAHDIGHTPFGHIGERTLNDILLRKDTLGGLLKKNEKYINAFKHNVNSMRIVYELNSNIDWRIVEGVLTHTKLYKDVKYNPQIYWKLELLNKTKFKGIHNLNEESKEGLLHSFTVEGQIVAVADEIAQRISDISDGIESKYYGKIKEILKIDKEDKKITKKTIENHIIVNFVDDVIDSTFETIKKVKPQEVKGLKGYIFKEKIVNFKRYLEINEELNKFIEKFITNSHQIRQSDSRSRYIIRQLFKAYVNDIKLLPDEVINNFLFYLSEKTSCPLLFDIVDTKKIDDDFLKAIQVIKRKEWTIKKFSVQSKTVLDFEVIESFMKKLKMNEVNDKVLCQIYAIYLQFIANYIAMMTDNEAFYEYNNIYGHTSENFLNNII